MKIMNDLEQKKEHFWKIKWAENRLHDRAKKFWNEEVRPLAIQKIKEGRYLSRYTWNLESIEHAGYVFRAKEDIEDDLIDLLHCLDWYEASEYHFTVRIADSIFIRCDDHEILLQADCLDDLLTFALEFGLEYHLIVNTTVKEKIEQKIEKLKNTAARYGEDIKYWQNILGVL